MVAHGEIWWVEHPEWGRRPALVLTRQSAILDTHDGMPDTCCLSLDNHASMPLELFRERITRLSVDRMNDVCRALSIATGCA